jgi:hypothetical protein
MPYSKSSVTDHGRGKNLTGFEYAHQHSSTPAEVPTAADLRLGELAVNSADAALYCKAADGTVKAIAAGVAHSGRKVIYVSKGDAATDTRASLSKYDRNVPFATLQAAATASASGDTILLEPGTHAVTGQRVLLPNGVSLVGIAGAVVTGAGGGVGWTAHGLLAVRGSSEIRNISFVATSDDFGASIYVLGDAIAGNLGGDVVFSDLKLRGGIDGFIETHLVGAVFIQNCDVATRWDCLITSSAAGASAKTYISNSRFECLALTNLVSRCVYVAGGEVRLDSSFLISRVSAAEQPNRTLMVSNEDGGTPSVFLTNCTVVADDTKSTTSAVFIETGGLVSLERSKLISTAASGKSVDSNAAVNVAVLSVFSNKAVGANVTQLVGTVTVSTNVA